ncbi:hypothetical protein H7J50_18935 [Mycobacterium intermedium]|nr:hypothetical protein [Mycobacterium intermedium]MCV6965867.1 hypothetical protein [Mycobacterium intermedium]
MPHMRTIRKACAIVLGIAMLSACGSRGPADTSTKPPLPSAPSFEGTYQFDFDGAQQLAGGELKPTNSRTRLYAVRSTCLETGCIATATKLEDGNPKKKSDPAVDLVLDYVNGHWQMAVREDATCTDSTSHGPAITVWILQPQPDGTLNGTSSVAMNPNPDCGVATQTPIRVKRVGDVDLNVAVANPARQASLSPTASAPNGLHGHYNETSVLRGDERSRPGVRRVFLQTTCVRNTDICATFRSFLSATQTQIVNSLLFDNGKWALNQRVDVNCPNGRVAKTVKHEEYALPQPADRPLQRLTGTMRFDAAESCPAQQVDISLERTGD